MSEQTIRITKSTRFVSYSVESSYGGLFERRGKNNWFVWKNEKLECCTEKQSIMLEKGYQEWLWPQTACYQCGEQTDYLFADSRCGDCTRLTPEEVRGDI